MINVVKKWFPETTLQHTRLAPLISTYTMEVMELIKISFLHVFHLVFVCTVIQEGTTSTWEAAQGEDEKSSFHPFLPSSFILSIHMKNRHSNFFLHLHQLIIPPTQSLLYSFSPRKFSILKDYSVLPWQPRRWCEEFRLSSDRLISL